MKNLLLVVVYFVTYNAFAQHANVQQTVQQISKDSLVTYVKQLTGLLPIGSDTIKTRYKGTVGNTMTEQYIIQKLNSRHNHTILFTHTIIFSPTNSLAYSHALTHAPEQEYS